MADPSLQSLCCIGAISTVSNRNYSSLQFQLLVLHQVPYYGISLASAILGFFGSLYQLSLRSAAPFPRYQYFNVGLRGNNILFYLACADSFAAIGLIMRSSVWFLPQSLLDVKMNFILCSIISAWIQFSYTSSHLWTLIYAVDVRRITFDLPFIAPIYHVSAWGGAVALCTTGLTLMYLPGEGCCNTDAYINLLPNHVATYLPLLITILSCPFLFISAFRQAETSLMRRYARYTMTERKLIDSLKLKFILIVSVFYLCWVPNLVNGLALWIDWTDLPVTWILVNLHLMALLNPLQGVFNILLYKIPRRRRQPKTQLQDWLASIRLSKIQPQEETPLLL